MTASAFHSIHDFFNSMTWYVIQTVASLLVVVLWIATVFWVHKDAKRRIARQPLVWLAVVVGAIPPFIGPLIYMLFRPPEYLEDVRERDLEIQAIEARLGLFECPVCHAGVDTDYLVCPVCTSRLREPCGSCRRPLEPQWQVCPYCETPVTRPGRARTFVIGEA
jgi:RNA polymerase subunit RPABC4/transcription elongation factor Spt4